jgi:hypothetical protein
MKLAVKWDWMESWGSKVAGNGWSFTKNISILFSFMARSIGNGSQPMINSLVLPSDDSFILNSTLQVRIMMKRVPSCS